MQNSIQADYISQVRTYLCQDKHLSDCEMDMILQSLVVSTYQKGDYILNEGEIESDISFILKGKVHQYSIIDSKHVTERVALSGSAFCSYISYKLQIPSKQIQQALTDTTVVKITKNQIESLLDVCPMFCQSMLKRVENIHLQREIRAYILQHKSALDRYRLFLKMEPLSAEYQIHIPQKYLASYIGLTPQAYSKAKNSFLRQSHF